MSHPPFPPRPRPVTPTAPRPSARPAAARPPGWGWLEFFVLTQTFLPALMFVPGLSKIRTITRIAAYSLGLGIWSGVAFNGKKAVTQGTFPARPWLMFVIIWLLLSLGHPNVYSLLAGFAHAVLYISILSPAFWASEAVNGTSHLKRVIALLFMCNALSALVGVGQVFYPDRLNPPVIPVMAVNEGAGQLYYETADGRKVLRPCGLTDTPGAAAPAGGTAALIGLCLALRPMPLWRRGAALGLAFIGVAVIYYTQVRSAMVVLAICLATVTALMTARGDFRNAVQMVIGGGVLVLGALAWVSRTMGGIASARFGTLLSDNPLQVYSHNRGYFLSSTFSILGKTPLGYGLGWWGMVNDAFRDPNRTSTIWVEVMPQAWATDGGIPLMIAYIGAACAAMYDSLRIALTTRDRELGFWAAVIVAQNLASMALCLSYPTFLAPVGMQFWMLASMLHGAAAQADAAARVEKPRRQAVV